MSDERLLEEVLAVLAEIKTLHRAKTRDGVTFCTSCVEPLGVDYQQWPCMTIMTIEDKWASRG